jgi:hypothetical protein
MVPNGQPLVRVVGIERRRVWQVDEFEDSASAPISR